MMHAACFSAPLARQLALALLGLVMTGCTGSLTQPQYLAYLADPAHGLTHTQEVNGTAVTCGYRPPDLLVSQELASGSAQATPALVDSLRRTYAGKLYCTLALARDSTELEAAVSRDENALTQTLSYLSNGIARDVYVRGLGQPDSTAALAAAYTRQYGNTGRSTVLLVFAVPQLKVSRGFTLTYRDTQFGLGPVHFVFTAQALGRLPALQL
ncbi:hypothetical protein GCM10027422_47440 [Hymenobacter arcticus]